LNLEASRMNEPTITCPNCQTEIRLTESLAAPLLAATKRDFQAQLARKDAVIAEREQGLQARELELAESRRSLEAQIAEQVEAKLLSERAHLTTEITRRTQLAAAADLDAKARELVELQAVLKSRDEKLAAAQATGGKLEGMTVAISQKAGVDGRLFGSVTNFDIATALNKQGFPSVEKAMVRLPNGPLKAVGEFDVTVALHSDVVVPVKVAVSPES
jgi:ribosomal protein L9